MENKVTAYSYLFGEQVVRAYELHKDAGIVDYLLQDRTYGEYISSDMYKDTTMLLEVAREWDGWFAQVDDAFMNEVLEKEMKRRKLNQ